MSPLDTHLRDTLAEHAGDVEAPRDLFGLVERRARALHRRRVALATTGTAAVAALAVVGGLTLTGGSGTDTVRAPITHGGSPITTGPTPLSSPSPATTATGTPASATAYPMSWPEVPKATVSWVQWPAVQASIAKQLPPSFDPPQRLRPLAVLDTDGGPAVLLVAASGGRTIAAAVLQSDPATAVAVHDTDSTAQVSAVVRVRTGNGTVDDGLVVAAPGAGRILFLLPGQTNYGGHSDPDQRWATITLGHVVPGQPVAQMRILDGDGKQTALYDGPIGVGVTFPDI